MWPYMRNPDSRRLYKAAHDGDVYPLREILDRYPSLLKGGSMLVAPYDLLPEPPLQVAAFIGHLNFVKRMLELEPSSAHNTDDKGLSPLHMAAANECLDIITHLLQFDSDLCFLCDNHGRNSLHFAAMNGRLQALQLLVKGIGGGRDVATLLNAKDNHGFTLLHFAVDNQHLEVVQYLFTLPIEVNALSSKGLTPLDLLLDCPSKYLNRVRMANFLRGHGAIRSSALNSTTSQEIWARKKNTLMLVASIMATMAFQAALNPPGGVWQEDGTQIYNSSGISSPQIAGKSVMSAKNPPAYALFITCASFAFIFSLIELFLHLSDSISNSGVGSQVLLVQAKYISTFALVVTYFISVAFLTTLPGRFNALTLPLFISTVVLYLLYAFYYLRRPSARRNLIRFPPPTP